MRTKLEKKTERKKITASNPRLISAKIDQKELIMTKTRKVNSVIPFLGNIKRVNAAYLDGLFVMI